MALRKIIDYPDKVLRAKAAEVTAFDATLQVLAEDMLESMYDANGIGLAGNQIGELQQIFVMDCAEQDAPRAPKVMVNPRVIWSGKNQCNSEEGCLSFPEQYADVTRFEKVEVKFQDVSGNWNTEHLEGLPARCAQHEIDHLNGILFIDRCSLLKRRMIVRRMNKLRRLHSSG